MKGHNGPSNASELTKRARQCYERIVADIVDLDDDYAMLMPWSLMGGLGGKALLLSTAAGHSGDAKLRGLATDALTKMTSAIEDGRAALPYLSNGYPGILWLIGKFVGFGTIDKRDYVLESLFAEYAADCQWEGTVGEYDLLTGASGALTSLLAHSSDPDALEAAIPAVKYLVNRPIDRFANGLFGWCDSDARRLRRKEEKVRTLDWGVAHGMSGALSVLVSADKAGLLDREGRGRLIELGEGLASVISQSDGSAGLQSRFFEDGSEAHRTIGWCYGSPGMINVLLRTASHLRREDWVKIARDGLLNLRPTAASMQPPSIGSSVADTGLCHGLGGIVLSFAVAQTHIDDDQLANAKLFWLDQLVSSLSDDLLLAGARYHVPGEFPLRVPSSALLGGASGTALALLGALDSSSLGWIDLLAL